MNCTRCGEVLEKTQVAENTVRWECPGAECSPRTRTIIGGVLNKVFN